MLENLDDIYKIIGKYNSGENYVSIFKEISGIYYYENYHSDILAYYLRDENVKMNLYIG